MILVYQLAHYVLRSQYIDLPNEILLRLEKSIHKEFSFFLLIEPEVDSLMIRLVFKLHTV